ncbi:transposase, partial [Actinomycetaceae bacterium WB03_NA08]
ECKPQPHSNKAPSAPTQTPKPRKQAKTNNPKRRLRTPCQKSGMGLFKNEAVRKDSPFRVGPLKTVADVEDLTLEWATWYNQDRLHSTIGYQTPSEAE